MIGGVNSCKEFESWLRLCQLRQRQSTVCLAFLHYRYRMGHILPVRNSFWEKGSHQWSEVDSGHPFPSQLERRTFLTHKGSLVLPFSSFTTKKLFFVETLSVQTKKTFRITAAVVTNLSTTDDATLTNSSMCFFDYLINFIIFCALAFSRKWLYSSEM